MKPLSCSWIWRRHLIASKFDTIWQILRYFGFGERFIRYVKTLFAHPYSCVINNGYKSRFFYPTRSVKQGCSTSPFLFILCQELLAINIRKNKNIQGITIQDMEHKIAQFADDITMYLKFDQQSLFEVVKELDHFYAYSGIAVNYDKTSVYRIGSLSKSKAKLYTTKPFYWSNDPITVLGIKITHDLEEMQLLNIAPIFDKMLGIFMVWQRRQLSLSGKVVIINNLINSLFLYKIACLDLLEEKYYTEYERLIKSFLWEGRPKMSLVTLYNAKENGGLNLINLRNKDLAFKAQWVSKFKRFKVVKNLALQFLPTEYIFHCNINPNQIDRVNIQSKFWSDVLYGWSMYHYKDSSTPIATSSIMKMPVFYNSQIIIARNFLTYKQAVELGVNTVSDFFVPNTGGLVKSAAEWLTQGCSPAQVIKIQGIVSAIPKKWMDIIKGKISLDYSNKLIFRYDYASIPGKLSAIVYKQITCKELCHSDIAGKWSDKLSLSISPQDLEDSFTNIKYIVYDVKMRDFQFRFLHRKIFTNYLLKIWKLVDSDRCTFCKDLYETIEHLFFQCNIVKRFWNLLQCWYEAMTDTEIVIDEKLILLNHFVPNKTHILDSLILMGKQHIYKCRSLNRELNFYNFKQEFFYTCKIERKIAFLNNRHKAFVKKWAILLK